MSAPAKQFVNITNNCTHVIQLPPTSDYEDGVKLIPGTNVVPVPYYESLKAFQVPYRHDDGARGKRPLFDDLAQPSRTSGGRPQVEVRGSIAENAEQGPPAPYSLAEYNEAIALKLIEVTGDKKALERWGKDPRPEIANAAKKKAASK